MATRLFTIGPDAKLVNVVEGVGAAASSQIINLTVDLASNTVNEGSSTRGVKKSEVLLALDTLKQYIIRGNWPPA